MRYLAVLAITAFVFTSMMLSLWPHLFEFIFAIPGRDKMVHFLIAGGLSFMVVAGFSTVPFRGRRLGSVFCLAAVALLITLDELIQLAIPSRTFALLDLGWGYAGVIVFGLIAVLWVRRVMVR